MKNEKRLLPLLLGATALAMVGVSAVHSQVVVGSQDFSITVQAAEDASPDAFGFASVLDVEPNTLVASAPITITGIDVPVDVSVSGSGSPEFRINGGAWGTTGQVENGQTIEVRLTSAPNYWDGVTNFNTTRQAVLTVGDGTGTFFVRNVLGSAAPDAFVFAGTTGVAPGARVTSAPITISGMQIAGPITVSGAGSPEISVDGGSWGTTGTISNGQTVEVRMTAPITYEAVRSASVTIGGVTGSWALTTSDCVTGDLFSLAVGQATCYNNLNVVNAGSGLITAGTIGTDYPTWTAARDLCSALGSEWGLPAQTAMVGTDTVNTNRALAEVEAVLNLSNSSTYWTSTTNQTVTLGPIPQTLTGVNSSASVICMTQPALTSQFVASEYVPDAFTIAATSGSPSTFLMSDPVTISGLEPSRSVLMRVSSASTYGPATFSVNGGAYSGTERSVTNGDQIRFGIISSPFNGGAISLLAETVDPAGTVNGSASWAVTSVASAAESVDQFAFNWQYDPQTYFGTFPGDIKSSELISLAGGTGSRPLQVLNSSGHYNSGTLNRWPRIYGSRIYYKNSNVTITTSLTDDANAVMWSTANTNYPDVVTDVGRSIRLKFAPANQSNEAYSILCVASTCAEHIWTNSATRSDPRAANAFDIVDVTGADLSTLYTSAPFTVSWDARTAGVRAPNIPISISGTGTPEYRINGGAWTSATGWVGAGSTVEVRLTSAATAGTDHTATLSVGTTTSAYTVRTTDDTTPDAFTVAAATGVSPDSVAVSAPFTITGVSASVPISVSGDGSPQLSLDGGVTWVSNGTVDPNGSVLVRLTSAAAYEATRNATIDVNGETSSWSVTTGAFSFAIAGKTDVLTNSVTVSDPVTLPAYLTASAISVSGDGAPEYSINGGAFTSASGTVSGGQTLRVRLTASSVKDAERVATVTIGTATAGFSVRTAPPEACETGAIGSVCSDGAVYAGTVNGNKIFVAPASETGTYQFMNANNASLSVNTQDGLQNAWAISVDTVNSYPAAQVCAARGSEWVLPSESEMGVMRGNRASMPAGTFSYTSAWYWTSTEYAGHVGYAYTSYLSGTSTSYAQKTTANRVHCIRYSRETPRPAITDPCAGSPAVGALCADGSVYAGLSNGERIFFESRASANVAWKTTATYTPGTTSTTDTVANRLAMEMNGGVAVHPAQQVCASKGTSSSGSAWYLPSRSDLAVLDTVRAQGAFAQMFSSSATGYVGASTWSSTQSGTNPSYASYMQKGGSFVDTGSKTSATTASVLCMRYDAPQVYADPCAGSPSVGDLCSDGTVYAGAMDGRQLRVMPVSGTFTQKTSSTLTIGTISTDGLVNTEAMVTAGLSAHPAANACRAIGPEFYLPSIEELRVIRTGGATAGVVPANTYHWSSSELPNGSTTGSAYRTYLNTATEGTTGKATAANVLCVSNGAVRAVTDPCADPSPTAGSLCADGTVYFGSIDGRKLFTTQADAGNFALSTSTAANPATTNFRDGRVNMAGMVGTAYPAANACRALGTGWYLPARDELALLATNANGLVLQQTFGSTGDYWSSTQYESITSRNWEVDLTGGTQGYTTKSTSLRVRCVRTN